MSNIINGIAKDLKSIPEKLKAKTGNIDKKKLVLMNLPYVLAGYFCDKTACLWKYAECNGRTVVPVCPDLDLIPNRLVL